MSSTDHEATQVERLLSEAEELAGKLSLRQLTPQESAEAVDIIFDLIAEVRRD